LVLASNTAKIWFARAYGESEVRDLYYRVARKSKLFRALAGVFVSALFMALPSLLMIPPCPDPGKDWGFWFGCGVLAYAFAACLDRSLWFIRVFRIGKREPVTPQGSENAPSKTA
jgi:hypothetical protein